MSIIDVWRSALVWHCDFEITYLCRTIWLSLVSESPKTPMVKTAHS